MHSAYARDARRRKRLTPRGREVGAGGVEMGLVRGQEDAARCHVLHPRHHLGPVRCRVRRVRLGKLPVGDHDVAGPAGVVGVERGEALSGERISQMYGEILRRYHGSDQGVVEIDELYNNEWMFVPHFYYNMYVFQYATSLTAGTALYEKIVNEGAAGVEKYKNLLRSGSSDYPYQLLRNAGVDMATPAPYQAVITRMNAVMDEIESLLDERDRR